MKYEGKLYVSENDYAVPRAWAHARRRRKLNSFNMKFLGIKAAEKQIGTIIYKKKSDGSGYFCTTLQLKRTIFLC
jgi:hypothetical protein